MHILVDEEIPGRDELFARLGTVSTFIGRSLSRADVRNVDALIVRSVTRVDAALLAGSSVRFVGTATSGTDHIDTAWLAANDIALADAGGCNAAAVAEYVVTAMLLAFHLRGDALKGKALGIIGVGRIGGRVEALGRALGMHLLRNDPPRARCEGPAGWTGLDDLLASADIVTLHVPLVHEGPDATADLLNAGRLRLLRPGAIFINTARGEAVDETALAALLGGARQIAGDRASIGMRAEAAAPPRIFAAIDVWRGEPDVDARLVQASDIATPHVAGYSKQAKKRASAAVFLALARWLGRHGEAASVAAAYAHGGVGNAPAVHDAPARDVAPAGRRGTAPPVVPQAWHDLADLRTRLMAACPIVQTTRDMHRLAAAGDLPAQFDRLRSPWAAREEVF